jgi:hypothetical protein
MAAPCEARQGEAWCSGRDLNPQAFQTSLVSGGAALRVGRVAGFLDDQVAALEFRSVEFLYGYFGFFFRHGDEAEPAEAALLIVHDEADILDGAVLGEEVLDFLFQSAVSDISDKERAAHDYSNFYEFTNEIAFKPINARFLHSEKLKSRLFGK